LNDLPPGAMRRRPIGNPLRDEARREEWGDALSFYLWQLNEEKKQLAPENEVRWGALSRQSIVIPAATAADFGTELTQIIDVRAPARGWLLSLALTWENQVAGVASETVNADFRIEYAVGSGRMLRAERLNVAQISAVNFSSLITVPFPAGSIYVSGQVSVGASALGGDRTYQLTLAALAAPVVR
jgi:hypothetical protein